MPASRQSLAISETALGEGVMPILSRRVVSTSLRLRGSTYTRRTPVERRASTISASWPSAVDIVGATRAYVLTPPSMRPEIALSLASGSGAPGSVIFETFGSTPVKVIPTTQSIPDRMSMSRRIRSDLVWMWTLLPLEARTSRHPLVRRNLPSAAWYGSVTVPMPIIPSAKGSSLDSLSITFLLTRTTLHSARSEWVWPGA